MPNLRVMTYNILYGGVGRERRIADAVRTIDPHVGIFTEVTRADSFGLIAEAIGPHHSLDGRRAARGCPAIVSRWPILDCRWHGPPWAPRKWVEATLRPFDGPPMTVYGVHLVPQPLWPFELCRGYEVRCLLRRLSARARSTIVAGDFNALMSGDTPRQKGLAPWVRAQWLLQGGATPRWALRGLTDAGYVDCYRACNPQKNGFTVPAWDPGLRIDYVFASPGLATALRASGTLESTRPDQTAATAPRRSLAQLLGWREVPSLGDQASDHLPVWADFEWPPATEAN
jgi:exodeoxyribonuclease III